MVSTRSSLTLVTLAAVATLTNHAQGVDASIFRATAPKTSFQWVVDPHAADPCTSEPGCVNVAKYGFNVVPINITSDATVVFQVATRPTGVAAVMNMDIYTQPGCVIEACHIIPSFLVLKKEDCYNSWDAGKATETDGKTAKIEFGGIYYEDLPKGELYAKFQKKNFLTRKPTCTYEVRNGFKRWF